MRKTLLAGTGAFLILSAAAVWLVSFLDYDLGFFDSKEDRVEPASNPFAPEIV